MGLPGLDVVLGLAAGAIDALVDGAPRLALQVGDDVVAATDRGTGGNLLAGRLEDLARRHGIPLERRRPAAKDWNEQLVGERHGDPSRPHENVDRL
jgi:hypothetical protein